MAAIVSVMLAKDDGGGLSSPCLHGDERRAGQRLQRVARIPAGGEDDAERVSVMLARPASHPLVARFATLCVMHIAMRSCLHRMTGSWDDGGITNPCCIRVKYRNSPLTMRSETSSVD